MKKILCLLAVGYLLNSSFSCRLISKSTRIFGRVLDQLQRPVPSVEIIINATQHGLPPQNHILAIPKTNAQGIYDTTVTVDKKYYQVEVIFQFPKDSSLVGKYRHYECRCNGQPSGYPSNGNLQFPTVEIGETSECNYMLIP